jgi:hypothetical protein
MSGGGISTTFVSIRAKYASKRLKGHINTLNKRFLKLRSLEVAINESFSLGNSKYLVYSRVISR